jgi:cobalt-zinc-cadmium efflux system outer membrane protein
MRLEELEQMAIANNPTEEQAQAKLRAAMGLSRQAGMYPNPTVGYYGDEIRGGYLRGGKQGAFVSQTIVLGGKLRAARRVAEIEASEIEIRGEMQRLRIMNSVRGEFYQVLAAQRLLEVRQNLATLAADAKQTSLQLGNVGQADRPNILQAEVEQQRANLSVQVARQNLQASWRMLAAVVGKPDLPAAPLEGELEAIPDLNYDECVATTLLESPEVKLAHQAVERAEASLSQAESAPIPDLQVTGILVQSNEPLEITPRPTGLQGGAQIAVQVPLFNRNQGNIAAAKGEIESAKQELARVKLELRRDLASMFRDYDSSLVTVQQYKTEMLPRAQQAYRMYQTSYQQMAAAYEPVLLSQRTLFQMEADYILALENAWQSVLAIRGFGLMDGLAQPGSSGAGMYSSRPATPQ